MILDKVIHISNINHTFFLKNKKKGFFLFKVIAVWNYCLIGICMLTIIYIIIIIRKHLNDPIVDIIR